MAGALTALGSARRHLGRGLGGRPRRRSTGDAAVDCGLAGTVMRFVPPVAGAVDRPGRLRRRPAHAHAPDRRGARPRCARSASRSTTAAAARCRSRCAAAAACAGGTVVDRRVGVLAVRLGAAAGRRPLRRGRRRAPRRQAGAVAAPHRHDRRDAARARRRGRRRRRRTAGRSRPGRSRARRPPDRAGPLQRGAVPGAGGGHRRPVTVRDWPRATTQAGDALREILTRMGCDGRPRPTRACASTGPGAPARHRRRPARRRRADARRSPPCARWPTRPRTCAASRTSAATRPTGWRRWPPSSAASAPT